MEASKLLKKIILLGILVNIFAGYAQDGEQLFKKCFTCHTLGKKSTGPDLVGVRAKWIEAGEGDMLFDWVKNSEALIASGKSQMANAIKDFSPTVMENQDLNDAEITAVFDYIDAWTPPAETELSTSAGLAQEIKYIPNYKKNLTLFYWCIALTIVLLFSIGLVTNSILTLVKSDYFKERISKKNNDKDAISKIVSIVLLIGFSLYGNNTFALTFNAPGMATEGQPWLLVEDYDLFYFLVVDIVLLCVMFYLRCMFNNFVRMVRQPQEKVVVSPVVKKINKVLTDAVDIEEEHTILMHHEYDGIRELDNNLPPWWLWGFYATIVFAIIYLCHYHIFQTGDLQQVAYEKNMAEKQKEVEEYLVKMAMNVDENSATLMEDENDLNQGKTIFEVNCVVCHLEDGSGKIGPNLTDNAWIYGYDIKTVFSTIKYGTSNGMPEHASKLKPTQIQQVASYLLHFEQVPNGKDPEGDIIREKNTETQETEQDSQEEEYEEMASNIIVSE